MKKTSIFNGNLKVLNVQFNRLCNFNFLEKLEFSGLSLLSPVDILCAYQLCRTVMAVLLHIIINWRSRRKVDCKDQCAALLMQLHMERSR